MDNGQLEKKLAWLDDQRQKDQEEIQRLKTQIGKVQNSVDKLSKQMEGVSTDLSRISATASKIAQFDEALAKHRTEISRQLKDLDERRSKKESQLEALRKSDQRQVVKSIDELEREIQKIDELEEKLEVRREEDIRLNNQAAEVSEVLDAINSKVEDQVLRLVSLEESSAQEFKRNSEIQTDLITINRKTDNLRNSIDAVEDQTRKMEVGISELKASDRERSDELEVWTDEQRMKIVEFGKEWAEWEKRFTEFEKETREIEGKIQAYDQTHRSIKQLQGQLEGLLERLERRITEVGEIQRLSQERMKQDWAAFEADETKKWATFKLSSEERWKEHQRIHDKLSEALGNLEDLRAEIREDIDVLIEREARKVKEIVALTRQWLQDQE